MAQYQPQPAGPGADRNRKLLWKALPIVVGLAIAAVVIFFQNRDRADQENSIPSSGKVVSKQVQQRRGPDAYRLQVEANGSRKWYSVTPESYGDCQTGERWSECRSR